MGDCRRGRHLSPRPLDAISAALTRAPTGAGLAGNRASEMPSGRADVPGCVCKYEAGRASAERPKEKLVNEKVIFVSYGAIREAETHNAPERRRGRLRRA